MASDPIKADDDLVADRYRIGRKLGTGGMASVYEAYDTVLDRTVALKRLRTDAIDEHVDRFRREARIGANLNHPNLVAVYDILISGDDVLISMEHVEGRSLGDLIQEGCVLPERTLEILADVAAALDHAHAAGIVHRDIKPANILLRDDGTAKVVDLGIATAMEESRLTASHQVIGTLSYMAPERLSGDGVGGPPADVYSMGMVALQLLAGELPWKGLNPSERLARSTGGAPAIDDAWPEGPTAARAVLERALEPDPAKRPASPSEFVGELASALDGTQVMEEEAESTATMPIPRRESGRPDPETVAPVAATAAVQSEPQVPGAASPDVHRKPAGERSPVEAPRRPGPPETSGASSGPAASKSSRPSRRALVISLLAVAALAVALVALSGGGDDPGAADQVATGSGSEGNAGSGKKDPKPESVPAPVAPAPEAEPDPPSEPEPNASVEVSDLGVGGDPNDPTRFATGGPENDALGATLDSEGYALFRDPESATAADYAAAVPILTEAVQTFEQGTTSQNYYFAIYNLGTALTYSGSPEAAIPFLEARLTNDDRRPIVRETLKDARELAGAG